MRWFLVFGSLCLAWGPAVLFLKAGHAGEAEGGGLIVLPGTPLANLRQKLATDATITEVVFQGGTYRGGLYVSGPRGADSARPLLIRAADGANVVFDGSRALEKLEPVDGAPGVFSMEHDQRGGEAPKLWEPGTRTRYRLVADRLSVARFPATFTVEGDRLLLHTSDGKTPAAGELLMSEADCGLFINRPNVTVRGIAFQNYLAREKWSTAIDLRVNGITAEACSATNCSLGFVVTGDDNVVRRCIAEDVGGGVYVGGAGARVEDCRLYKRRDAFMVPMYAQDDTGIQYYAPARGGIVRGNLCAGFGMGVFIKATAAPYVVEHNTLVGGGQGLGFGATNWHEGERFRRNIISGCERQVEVYSQDARPGDVDYNCYWPAKAGSAKPVGRNDVVADPRFVWPEWNDYRLSPGSPALKLADEAGPAGAFPAAGDGVTHLGPPRRWHVSESGRDGRDGSTAQPVRTIQYAVDRARPGDTIIIHPGLYGEPVRIRRGGTKDKPITIRAAHRWAAVLDSSRSAAVIIDIKSAPYVEVHDLEIRWYGQVGVRVTESPHVTVAGCRIWNAHWHGAWPTGTAVRVERSPGFTGRENVAFRQEHAFWFYHSPGFSLTHNTCVANLYSAAAVLYSCENSVCRNNSFAFQGNDVIVIEEAAGDKQKLRNFDCDYNNYGTALRRQPDGTAFDSISPRQRDAHLAGGSKALVNYNEYRGEMKRFVSLQAWRDFSGLDRHTLVADPLYVNTIARDFRLENDSPNRGGGAGRATIGAPAGDDAAPATGPATRPAGKAATGPLRVHPANPRYFADGTGRPVYLTGSHHWHNFQDAGRIGQPISRKLDYDQYLRLLTDSGHNFIRLWAWEGAAWWWQGGENDEHYEPLPYRRTGPGKALDGKPKFDLNEFNPEYFERLRSHVVAARDKGIYVSVMLFQGWSIYSHDYGNPWPLHPFNAANNVNSINGDRDRDGAGKEVHSLDVPEVTRLQEAYIRKVVDTLNDLDNVLYEVTNETAIHSREWQYHIIRFVKEYEKGKPNQHAVGMTYFDSGPRGSMEALLAGPADWISPGDDGGRYDFKEDPPPADGRKVVISDTDHIWGVGGDADWVWRSFTRGHNPIYMDPLGRTRGFKVTDEQLSRVRKAMGQSRRLAERINLATMKPAGELASTRFCLADAGKEYVVFLPKGGGATVDLSAVAGALRVEWLNPARDEAIAADAVVGGAKRELKAPFAGAAVLYLKSAPRKAATGPLRVHPDNGRYFTDGSRDDAGRLKAVYLTGSHTWPNLIDRAPKDPPPAFDFEWYLRLLEDNGHNFIRLWSRHVTWYHDYGDKRVLHAAPLAWERRGPGEALDGKPKFDLSRFNEAYFERLRSRVKAAGDRGIYVSVMLFGGSYECRGGWRGNPFNAANNVNRIDGDPDRDGNGLETQTLDLPAVMRLQEAYVRKVIDTVGDLDNVLLEISNESDASSKAWQAHLVKLIHDYEAAKPKQHPVGMTALMDNDNEALYASEADWVSPSTTDAKGLARLPPADGRKVSLLDSDHWFISSILKDPKFGRDWVWQAFCNGHNPILMENLPLDSGSEVPVTTEDPGHVASRRAMGQARHLAKRINLASMTPRPELSSTGRCLAAPGAEYVVYQPKGRERFSVRLEGGPYHVEWFDAERSVSHASGRVPGDGPREFAAPFEGAAVLYLRHVKPPAASEARQ